MNRRALHALFGLMVAAILANGLYFWLQKSQLVPSPTYTEYRQKVDESYELEARGIFVPQPQLLLDGFYAVPGKWVLTKLVKDVFCLAAILLALFLWWRSRIFALPASVGTLALAMLASLVFIAGIISIGKFSTGLAALGFRPFAYVAAGLLVALVWRGFSLELLGRYLLAVLIIELALGIYEYAYGLSLFNTARLTNRINGTLSYPSSLGILAVCALAIAVRFSSIKKLFLLPLTAVLVYMTGSATALVLLVIWVCALLVGIVPDRWKPSIRVGSLVLLAGLLLAMPRLVSRYDVMDSLWGRVEVAEDYIRHRPGAFGVIFGKGLGIGSNVFTSAVKQSDAIAEPDGVDMFHARADSTPMALVNQVGLIGLSLFYLVLGSAAWRDSSNRPIYAVLFFASLTINVLELFPVNFLLGLMLGRSLLFSEAELNFTKRGEDGLPHLGQT